MAKAPKTSSTPKREYKIVKKKSGRYVVHNFGGKIINGEKKVAILLKEGILKALKAKKKENEAAPTPPAE